jgi:hypothetical protein
MKNDRQEVKNLIYYAIESYVKENIDKLREDYGIDDNNPVWSYIAEIGVDDSYDVLDALTDYAMEINTSITSAKMSDGDDNENGNIVFIFNDTFKLYMEVVRGRLYIGHQPQ